MAERRMFTQKITESDAFIEMPLSAQALYFHLGILAYDKGVLYGARSITNGVGGTIKDIEILEAKGFIRLNDDDLKTCQIVHWEENNGIAENAKKRISYSYRQWREEVLRRDNYRCTKCGAIGHLEAHHIKPFAKFPNLRLDVENGVTLCHDCHRAYHKEENSRGSSVLDAT